MKRLRADDSADPCVKVGHRQALTTASPLAAAQRDGVGLLRRPPAEGLQRPLATAARRKIFRLLCQETGNCVIIQGFADRGGARR